MDELTVEIYDLESLAEKEGVTYTNLRTIMHKLRKSGEPLEWKGYRFFGMPKKVMYAYKADSDIEIHIKVKEKSGEEDR